MTVTSRTVTVACHENKKYCVTTVTVTPDHWHGQLDLFQHDPPPDRLYYADPVVELQLVTT